MAICAYRPSRALVITLIGALVLGVFIWLVYPTSQMKRLAAGKELEQCIFNGDADCIFEYVPEHERRNMPLTVDAIRTILAELNWTETVDATASAASCDSLTAIEDRTGRKCWLIFKSGKSATFKYSVRDGIDGMPVAPKLLQLMIGSYTRATKLKDPQTAGINRIVAARESFAELVPAFRRAGIKQITIEGDEFIEIDQIDRYFERTLARIRAPSLSEQ